MNHIAQSAWGQVWNTTIGSGNAAVRLADLQVPATVVGYFFEVLFAREVEMYHPEQWRGNKAGNEKDLVHLQEAQLSVEIKTSGQLGYKIFGNRSYGQEIQNQQRLKKEKSGFYITVNFYGRTLTLLRFGWIDASDWKPQLAPTGQMAGLPEAVYTHKLLPITGEYQLDAPIEVLDGVGVKTSEKFRNIGIHTVRQLLDFQGQIAEARLEKLRCAATMLYRPEPSLEK